MSKIIDISKYNIISDWDALKNNCDGVIIRCAYRGYGSGKIVRDAKMDDFAKNCKAYKIPFGFYFMSQAITTIEAVAEAQYIVQCALNYGAKLPLFIDSEDGDGTAKVVRADGLSKDMRTLIVKTFCETVNMSGLKGGVYASESWYHDKLNYSELLPFVIWVANYDKNNTGSKVSTVKLSKCDMHQYTSKGNVAGVQGNVDVSECYFMDFNSRNEQIDYKVGTDYFCHANGLRVRENPSLDAKVLYQISNCAVSNKAVVKDDAGRIWLNVSGTNRKEWACAYDGKNTYIK